MKYITENLDKFEYPVEFLDNCIAGYRSDIVRAANPDEKLQRWHRTRLAKVEQIRSAIVNQDTDTLELILATNLTTSEEFGTQFTEIFKFLAHYLKRMR